MTKRSSPTGVGIVLLAAGCSTRFNPERGRSKLAEAFLDVPIVRRAATTALSSRAKPVIVVTGYAAMSVRSALSGLALQYVHNENYASGMASSIKVGIAALPPDATGVLMILSDMPFVEASTLNVLIDAFEHAHGADAVLPVFEGKRGNPALIARKMFGALELLQGDQGARAALRDESRSIVLCGVNDQGVVLDIDTREALSELRKSASPAA
jgi:molybdenum cofactor cytidylyltransferase